MARTSDKGEKILQFISEYMQENGYAPSVREIGQAVGLRSTATVTYHLEQLRQKGLLLGSEEKGKKRAISTGVQPGQIPLIGMVTAGIPILAVENREGTVSWDGDPGCFALRVRGYSMKNAAILDGDIVVVRPQVYADDGQIVVARIEDEATVKRLSYKDGEVWLMPENPDFEPINGNHADILGVVKGVLRRY